jgi:hypothetical protein
LDGSSYAVRENLADILQRELLGPIHGPEETLPFSPRSQYLVGHIAPVKLVGQPRRFRKTLMAETSSRFALTTRE